MLLFKTDSEGKVHCKLIGKNLTFLKYMLIMVSSQTSSLLLNREGLSRSKNN